MVGLAVFLDAPRSRGVSESPRKLKAGHYVGKHEETRAAKTPEEAVTAETIVC
jgi:hypothetical protein